MRSFKPFRPVVGSFEEIYPRMYGGSLVTAVLWLVDRWRRRQMTRTVDTKSTARPATTDADAAARPR